MTLTGQYAERAKGSYKTVEGRALLSAVRRALALLDEQMKKPASYERGAKIASILSALELSADRYDLYGEKDRRHPIGKRAKSRMLVALQVLVDEAYRDENDPILVAARIKARAAIANAYVR